MVYTNLDLLARRYLLERRLPIHFYPEVLYHCASCVRDLSKDTLKIINVARLPVNSYFAVDLPMDFDDDIAVAVPAGNQLQYVPKNNILNPLRVNNEDTGVFESYNVMSSSNNANQVFGFNPSWDWFWNVNDWGEFTGRYFGANGGSYLNGYSVVKKRRQIQLTETFTSDEIILLYISDGQQADNASQIDSKATTAIHRYVDWQRSPNAAIELSPEGSTFSNQKRLLRAQLDDLTCTDIKQIYRSKYTAAMKS